MKSEICEKKSRLWDAVNLCICQFVAQSHTQKSESAKCKIQMQKCKKSKNAKMQKCKMSKCQMSNAKCQNLWLWVCGHSWRASHSHTLTRVSGQGGLPLPSLTHCPLPHPLTHPPTHSLTHFTHTHTHTLAHSLHPHTAQLTARTNSAQPSQPSQCRSVALTVAMSWRVDDGERLRITKRRRRL